MMQLAKLIGEIATGQAEDEPEVAPDPGAVKRGKARAAKLSAKRRKEIAKKAARTRWRKQG